MVKYFHVFHIRFIYKIDRRGRGVINRSLTMILTQRGRLSFHKFDSNQSNYFVLTVIACKQTDKQTKFIFKFISDSRCWNLYLTMLNGWTNGNSFIRLNNISFSSLYNWEIYSPSPPPGKIKSTREKSMA